MPKTLIIWPKWRNFAKSGHTARIRRVSNCVKIHLVRKVIEHRKFGTLVAKVNL